MIRFLLPLIFVGCGQKAPENKSWLSVEKAPMRVVIVCDDEDLTPELINRTIKDIRSIPYKDYYFNENMSVSATGNSQSVDTSTTSEIHGRSMSITGPTHQGE